MDDHEIILPERLKARPPEPVAIWTQRNGKTKPGNDTLQHLRQVLHDSISPDRIVQATEYLFELMGPENPDKKVRLDAVKYFMDRICGKPESKLNVKEEKVTAQVNIDATQYTDDELKQLATLAKKGQVERKDG